MSNLGVKGHYIGCLCLVVNFWWVLFGRIRKDMEKSDVFLGCYGRIGEIRHGGYFQIRVYKVKTTLTQTGVRMQSVGQYWGVTSWGSVVVEVVECSSLVVIFFSNQ